MGDIDLAWLQLLLGLTGVGTVFNVAVRLVRSGLGGLR